VKKPIILKARLHFGGNFEKKLGIATSTVHYNFEKFKTKVFENPPVPERGKEEADHGPIPAMLHTKRNR
jgi:hypothetical protein